jgi:hypothetical protein
MCEEEYKQPHGISGGPHEPIVKKKKKEPHEEKPPLVNHYRDNLRIDAVSQGLRTLQTDVDSIKVDLTNFVGALLQSGVVELVKDEEGNVIYKINKVVLVDESVQQD